MSATSTRLSTEALWNVRVGLRQLGCALIYASADVLGVHIPLQQHIQLQKEVQ